jgi:membrane associated rhomboid family serine protease
MFPLRDTVRPRTHAYVTWSLIAVSVAAFLLETSLRSRTFDSVVLTYGLIPASLSLSDPAGWLTLLTSIFLHGSWLHLVSNLWMLFIFGDNVEDRLGHGRFLGFYLLSGVVAGLAHSLLAPGSTLPTIGASGAIAGVLGAYFVLFPSARVLTFVPLIILPWLVEIPAFVYLGVWFLLQVTSGLLDLGAAGAFAGIAWWAHIGGFVFGALTALLYLRPVHTAAPPWYDDDLSLPSRQGGPSR